jgi:hypothetical protein
MKKKSSPLFTGIYAWISTVFFGAVLMDVIYASFLAHAVSSPALTSVFSDVSDMMLRLGFLLLLSAFLVLFLTWETPSARNYLLASLFLFGFEFTLPMLFPSLRTSLGPFWIRLLLTGTASILAFIGQHDASLKE